MKGFVPFIFQEQSFFDPGEISWFHLFSFF